MAAGEFYEKVYNQMSGTDTFAPEDDTDAKRPYSRKQSKRAETNAGTGMEIADNRTGALINAQTGKLRSKLRNVQPAPTKTIRNEISVRGGKVYTYTVTGPITSRSQVGFDGSHHAPSTVIPFDNDPAADADIFTVNISNYFGIEDDVDDFKTPEEYASSIILGTAKILGRNVFRAAAIEDVKKQTTFNAIAFEVQSNFAAAFGSSFTPLGSYFVD